MHQKNDLFTIVSAKELAIANKIGYFGNEHIYINLYNTIQTTYDVYKVSFVYLHFVVLKLDLLWGFCRLLSINYRKLIYVYTYILFTYSHTRI